MDIGKLNWQVIIAGLTLLRGYKPTTNQIFTQFTEKPRIY